MTRRTFACWLAALALAGAALGAESRLEQFLPADAMVTVCYYGDNPDIEKTALAQLLQEPEVTEWLLTARQAIAGANQMAAAFLKVNPEFLKPLLGCRFGLALLPGEAQGPPQALLVAHLGKAGDLAREQVGAFLTQFAAMAGGPGEKIQVGGLETTHLGAGPAHVFYGLREEFLFAATSRQALERGLSPDPAKLTAQASFQRAAAMAGSPVLLVLYDHAAAMERFGGAIPKEVQAAFAAVGLNELRSVGLRLAAKGRALVGTLLVQTAGERRGLLRAMASAPVDRSLLRLIPRDAEIAWVSNVDPAELYDAAVAAIAAIAPEDIRAAIGGFEGRAGLNLRGDLFAALGRGTVVTTSDTSVVPALVVSQAAKDGERVEAALGKLVRQLDALVKAEGEPDAAAELRTIRFGDHTIRYLATPGVPVPVAPCFARQGDRIVFALSPIHLKDYLAFLDKAEPSILDRPGYKELEPLIAKDATSVSYSDFAGGFVGFYETVAPLLTLVQGIPRNPVPLDLANAPSARTLRKHLFGSISYSYATDDLIVYETHSPLGFGSIGPLPSGAPAVALLGIGAALTLPAIASARGAARTTVSANNLRQISMAINLYAENHNGDLPPNLAALLDGNLLAAPQILLAPNDPGPPQVNGRPCSYVYCLDGRPGAKLKLRDIENANLIPIVWERDRFQRGRRNVAFADGHVESMIEQGPEAAFEQALARLNALLKAKAGKAGGGEL